MKYWWLEKYHDFKIIQVKELQEDINYFLTMPKNYEKQYQLLKEKDIDTLEEEELLILLKRTVNTKKIKDNSLSYIIEKLLLVLKECNRPYDIVKVKSDITNELCIYQRN